jgi:SAM-dependent methyltransferase
MPATAQGFPTQESLANDAGENLEVVECAGCGLVQLTNTPVSYYRDVIRAAAYSPEMGEFRLQQFKGWTSQYGLVNKKILEIGCGKGEYLTLLQASTLDAYGIEHAQDSVAICQKNGLKVSQGYLGDDQENAYKDGFFDGFVCLNFMEHWPEPRKSLQALLPKLADGAIGLVEVPNFDMIVQKGLFSEFIADHLLYFTQHTLTQFLQNNGFEVLECKPVWQDYILSAVVRKRKTTDLSFFADFRSKISENLHAFIDQFPAKKVAVWGAGHQALAVISLAEIAQKITYVVDSAPFKQGKFTPATHLPIVSPQTLIDDPIEAIIVMAASYSDEVARNIKSQFPHVQHIAILRDDGLEIV